MSTTAALVQQATSLNVRSDVPAQAWDEYVARSSQASAYHQMAWAGVIARAFGHRTHYLAAYERDRIVGLLPLVLFSTPLFGRFATSMPFLNYGGVIADTTEAAAALLEAATAIAQSAKCSYLELRHSTRVFEGLAAREHKVSMVLPLKDTVEDQWNAIDRKLRNQVRKAEKSGLRTEVGGEELLGAFYDVLARNMRDLGSPVLSRRFFKEVVATFPASTKILAVYKDSTPIAASFVLWHRDRIEVPWASAIRTYNALCPNVLLYWEMLKFAIERRFAQFDFGRSTPLEGTYKFKEQWGAEPHQLFWEYWLNDGVALPDRGPKNPKFSAAISVWQRLPVAVTRAVGPLIVRNIP